LSEPVSYCPHCGVQARIAFGEAAPGKRPRAAMAAPGAAPGARAGASAGIPLHQVLWPSPPTPLFDSPEKDPYGEVHPPAPATAARQRALRLPLRRVRVPFRVKTSTALTLSAFAALLALGVFLHRHNDALEHEQKLASSTVQGSVTAAGAMGAVTDRRESSVLTATNAQPKETAKPVQSPQNAPSANERATATSAAATPAIAPATVGASAAAHASTLSAAAVPPVAPDTNDDATAKRPSGSTDSVAAIERAPSGSASAQTARSSSARSQSEPASARATAGDKRYGDKNRRLMALALARAHTGLQNNDLRMARSGVFWALSLQPDNSEALALKQALLAREKAAAGAREKAAASARQ
jgi:hypothetical protein